MASTNNEYQITIGGIEMEVHKIDYGQRVYQGTLDAIRQVIIATMLVIDSYNGETIGEPWISDRDEYVAGATPSTGAQVAYTLDEPLEIPVSISNTPIKSLSGYNHIESSTGDMDVEYITEEYQPLVDLISGSGNRFEGLDWDRASTLTLPDYTGYSYTPPCEGVLISTSYGSVGSTIVKRTGYDDMNLSYRADTWSTAWIPVTTAEYTLKRGASGDSYPSGSWLKFIPWKITTGGDGGSSSCDYSTTEHVVGKWIDGSDVYERTVHLDSLSSSPLDWETLFQESVGVIVSVTGCFLRTTGEMCDIGSTSFGVCYNPTIHQGYVCYYYTESNISEFTITVRYTKTSSNNRSLSTLSKGPNEESVDKVDKVDEPTETIEEKEETER